MIYLVLLACLAFPARAGQAERPFAPPRGSNRILVLLVNFADTTPTYTPAQFQDLFFGAHESTFRDYYLTVSYGQLDHVGDVVGWLTVSQTHDYYANNEFGQKTYPTNAQQLVAEAVDLAEAAGVDFRLYDNPLDGATDGMVDGLIVVHQGQGGEIINNPRNIGSFTGALSGGGAQARFYDGVVIDYFAIVPEISYYGDRLEEIGPIVHEYGHLLGLDDLSDRNGGSAGVGVWDYMSYGVWGGDRVSPEFPVLPSAYDRLILGWATPVVVGGSTQGWFALPAAARLPLVLKAEAGAGGREFFLAEYRPKTGYDRNLPAGGVNLYHVDYRSQFGNRDTFVGCGSLMPRVAVEQADGNYQLELFQNYGDTSDPYPRAGGGAVFHSASVPDSRNHDCRLTGFSLTGFTLSGDTAWVYARSDDFRPHSAVPELMIDGLEWMEVAGDHDRYLDAGEIFTPVLTASNSGAEAFGLTASFLSDSPFLLLGSTEMVLTDLEPGATIAAAGGPYLTVLPGFNPELAEPITVLFAYVGGSQEVAAEVRPGAAGVLFVDDDGGDVAERNLAPQLTDLGLAHEVWEVAKSGPPTSADLAGFPAVLWVTGVTPEPLDSAELTALQAYLDGGGTLVLSSPYLLIKPTAGAESFAQNYLHLAAWTDDRYASDYVRGITNSPLSHMGVFQPMEFYHPLFNRVSGLTPDSLTAGAYKDDYLHYAATYFPSGPSVPGVFRAIFFSFGIENIARSNMTHFLRRTFNVYHYRSGLPWAVYLTPERAQPRTINLSSQVSGFGFLNTDHFSFTGSGITVVSSSRVNGNYFNLVLRVAYNADPGWHDLIITTAAGNTAHVPRMFKVEGQPLPNHAPNVVAGPDQDTVRNTIITLNGASSSDPDYEPITYLWTQTAGTPVTLAPSNTAPIVTFNSGSEVGTLRFTLTVSDPLTSAGDTVNVNVLNRAPLARAGADQAGYRAEVFSLNGSSTSDPDGDALTTRWVQTAGPAVVILPSDTARLVSFVPAPDWVGDYRFRFDATDPWITSSDTVTVTVQNHVPLAAAGPDQRVTSSTWVTLDGSGSFDLDGDSLDFQWVQDEGPEVLLDLTDPVHPLFFLVDPGNYHFSLRCADPFDLSPADGVTVMINIAPVAEAGPAVSGWRGGSVTLDGSLSSDPNGDPLGFLWQQLSGPTVTLSGATAPMAAFTAPTDYLGDLVFQLTVDDGLLADSDTVTVTIQNRPPQPRAGQDQFGLRSQEFLLDGGSSSDPDGDPFGCRWQQLSGPAVALAPGDTAVAVHLTPDPHWVGRYVFELVAADPWDQAGDTVAVSVFNQRPTAEAGSPVLAILGDTVTLDGDSSTDLDGDSLAFTWEQLSGPAVTLDYSNPNYPHFLAAATGNYLFQLVADDSFDVSDADTVQVVILSRWNHRPVADAGPDQTLDWVDFDPVQLDGTGSYDPDLDPLTYHWTLVAKPALSSAALSDPASPTPTFSDDYLGTYVFRLAVYDGEIWSDADEVTVLTTGDTIDHDQDGYPDCIDPDDDNDALPDDWETATGLDPLSALDGDSVAVNAVTDPDGDGNNNFNEYFNGSDPLVSDRVVCDDRIGGCFFGESDGDFFYTPGDLDAFLSRSIGLVDDFPAAYPHNGDNFDLDGDIFITPSDVDQLRLVVIGVGDFGPGLPTQAVMVAPGYTVEAAAGATVGLTFRVVSSTGVPRSGLAVVFQLFAGAGKFVGGEGPAPAIPTVIDQSGLNTTANESAFAMSRDELEVYVASDRPGGLGGFDLYTARRGNLKKEEFGSLTNAAVLNSAGYESTPALAADRLEIFFSRYVTSWDIYRSTRATVDSSWSTPQAVTGINTIYLESAPSLTDDGLTLYFVRYVSANPGHEIYRARRATTSSTFGAPEAVTELNSTATDNLPNISGDDTRIYFMSNRNAGATDYNIYFAERSDPGQPFSTPVALSRINTSLGDLQAWESPDRLRLYLSTYGYHATSDVNIYQLWRPSTVLPYWSTIGTARYDVSGTIVEDAAVDSGGRVHVVFKPFGCGAYDIAAYGSRDVLGQVMPFAAARMVRVTVPCP